MFDTINQDVTKHCDYILERGYTGIISEKHTDDILGSILVSIWNKRVLCLKEFKEGMALYGLASILSHIPAACKPLFGKGLVNDVDANYLTEVLQPLQKVCQDDLLKRRLSTTSKIFCSA